MAVHGFPGGGHIVEANLAVRFGEDFIDAGAPRVQHAFRGQQILRSSYEFADGDHLPHRL
jgi:hypothetical protein